MGGGGARLGYSINSKESSRDLGKLVDEDRGSPLYVRGIEDMPQN